MFYKHFVDEENNAIYLFIDNSYEFSKDFNNKNIDERNESLFNKIKNYLVTKNVKFNGKKIFLVSSGIILGSLYLSPIKTTELNIAKTPKVQYVVSLEDFNKVEVPQKNNIETNIEKNTEVKTEEQSKTQANVSKTKPVEYLDVEEPHNIPKSSTISNTTSGNSVTKEEEPTAEKIFQNPITLYRASGSVEVMELEEFIVGVVSAEMPASFNIEALKTQAIASRTYYLKALSQNKKITEISDGQQVYKDESQLKNFWGTNFNTYYNKVRTAVEATKGKYISYNNQYIEAVYSSTNNGHTESSLDVWGNYYPYLISVDSPWDISASSYLRTIEKDLTLVNTILGINIDETSEIQIVSRTQGENIKEVKIGDSTFGGIYIREMLGLRSADFDFKVEDNKVIITTRGYGHGVGMSQYGANGMGNQGYNYVQIINHYYPNTTIKSM